MRHRKLPRGGRPVSPPDPPGIYLAAFFLAREHKGALVAGGREKRELLEWGSPRRRAIRQQQRRLTIDEGSPKDGWRWLQPPFSSLYPHLQQRARVVNMHAPSPPDAGNAGESPLGWRRQRATWVKGSFSRQFFLDPDP